MGRATSSCPGSSDGRAADRCTKVLGLSPTMGTTFQRYHFNCVGRKKQDCLDQPLKDKGEGSLVTLGNATTSFPAGLVGRAADRCSECRGFEFHVGHNFSPKSLLVSEIMHVRVPASTCPYINILIICIQYLQKISLTK